MVSFIYASSLFKEIKKVLYSHKNNVNRGRYTDRGATSVRARLLALSFRVRKYKLIPYPFNGGIPGNPTIVQVTSRKSIPTMHSYRFTPSPALCNEIHSCTTLTQQFRLFNIIIEIQKGLLLQKGRETRGATFIS